MKDNITDFKIVNGKLIKYTGKAEKLILPCNVTKIGKKVFHSCENIRIAELSENLTLIEEEAFYDCENLI